MCVTVAMSLAKAATWRERLPTCAVSPSTVEEGAVANDDEEALLAALGGGGEEAAADAPPRRKPTIVARFSRRSRSMSAADSERQRARHPRKYFWITSAARARRAKSACRSTFTTSWITFTFPCSCCSACVTAAELPPPLLVLLLLELLPLVVMFELGLALLFATAV